MLKLIRALAQYVSRSKNLSKARGVRAAGGANLLKSGLKTAAGLSLGNAVLKGLGSLGPDQKESVDSSLPTMEQYTAAAAASMEANTPVRHTDVPALIENMEEVRVPAVIPELGPNDGQYAPHLNLIIERIARLETRVNTQSALLNSLRSVIDSAVDQNEALDRKDERRRDEAEIEGKKTKPKIGSGIGGKAAALGGGILAAIEKYVGNLVGLAAGAGLLGLQLWEPDPSEEEPLGIMDALDEAENFIAQATVGLSTLGVFKAGEQLGRDAKAKQLKAERAARPVNQRPKVPGQVGTTADGKPVVKSKAGNLTVAGADGKATTQIVKAEQVKPLSPTGASAPTGTGAAAGKMGKGSKEGSAFMKMLQKFQGIVKSVQSGSKKIIEGAKTYLMKFGSTGSALIQKIGRFVVKWFLIIEAITFMIRSTELYMFGSITKDEWHKGNKEQINTICKLFGPMWLLCLLGTLSPIPGGAIMGFVIGLFYGDEIYDAIAFDQVVAALYDCLVTMSFQPLIDMFKRFYDWFMNELPKILGEKVKAAGQYMQGIDVIAEQEDIQEEYGTTSNLGKIALEATDTFLGMGVDENALLYVADNINSREQLREVDNKIMEEHGIGLIDLAKDKLNEEEFQQFVNVLDKSIAEGDAGMEEKAEAVKNYVDDPYVAKEGDYLTAEAMKEIGASDTSAEEVGKALSQVAKVDITKEVASSEEMAGLVEDKVSPISNELETIAEEVENKVKVEAGSLVLAAGAAAERALSTVNIETVLPSGKVQQMAMQVPTDIVKEVRGQDSTIVPIIMGGASKRISRAAGSSPASQVENSNPSYNTRDNFLTVSNYT